MGRDVDERKKRAALKKLRKAAELAGQGLGPPLSGWEQQFLEEVEERIEKFGSAFADPSKGDEGEALSALQRVKLKEIDKKARGKGRKGFGARSPMPGRAPVRGRDISEDVSEPGDVPPEAVPGSMPGPAPVPKASGRPVFRVIEGGKSVQEG